MKIGRLSANKSLHLGNGNGTYSLLVDDDGLNTTTAEAFTRPYLTRTCRVCSWKNLLTVLQSRAVAASSNLQLLQTRTLKDFFQMVFAHLGT